MKLRFPHPRPSPSHRLGGSTIEYLLVLALIVIPLALLSPLIIHMIVLYLARIATIIRMPLG